MDELDADRVETGDVTIPAARVATDAAAQTGHGTGRRGRLRGPSAADAAVTGATTGDATPWRDRLGGPSAADAAAGLITALFSVPEGMAYAAMAGFDPAAGLYTGVWPAVVGSLLAQTPLMVTTLTSAIALTSGGALRQARLDPTVPGNVAALTLLVALAMALFALLRLGSLLRLVPAGAMTGFSVGIALQIITGALHDATGFRAHQHNRLLRVLAWAAHPGAWSMTVTAVAVLTVLVWALAHVLPGARPLAVLIALVATAALVHAAGIAVPLAGSLGRIPDGVPPLTVPAWQAMPRLVGGAGSVALVALAQAAGIAPARPSAAGGPAAGRARDMLAQAAANAAGAFCHALPAGGSLSRTAVSASAGARTRWAGVASGCALALLLCGLGAGVGLIPLPVIGALLIVIGAKLIAGRAAEIRAAWCGGPGERATMVATFLASTQLPLQYALLPSLLPCLARLAASRRRAAPHRGDTESTSAAAPVNGGRTGER
ncbi:SulP family sulfate permease [Kitasatospora sp. GP30]|uniref:SulP family inorganic anion transporter n=1 Tax=Kitasatospora sp. GP30 TaxID=3035084 RepID=UPI000CB0D134|nr:SulP family inorganic anion transporter [Kitasatospora sp. GP30]MDH6143614.1 SulP family sulfate permease [Kitasatospora sp. GP30]